MNAGETTMRDRVRQNLNVIFAILQLVTNAFGGIGINGVSVATVSDSYKTLFTPAGYTFSVWGPIYLGLTAYAIYQALPNQREREIHRKIGWLTIAAAVANAIWTPIFTLRWIILSLIVIVGLLMTLSAIFIKLRTVERFTVADRWAVQIPYYGYFAWITVATIANATVLLLKLGWNGFGIDAAVWSTALIITATVIASAMIFYSKRVIGLWAYLAVLVWAFVGVYNGNTHASTLVGMTALIAAAVLVIVTAVRFFIFNPSDDNTITETISQVSTRA